MDELFVSQVKYLLSNSTSWPNIPISSFYKDVFCKHVTYVGASRLQHCCPGKSFLPTVLLPSCEGKTVVLEQCKSIRDRLSQICCSCLAWTPLFCAMSSIRTIFYSIRCHKSYLKGNGSLTLETQAHRTSLYPKSIYYEITLNRYALFAQPIHLYSMKMEEVCLETKNEH